MYYLAYLSRTWGTNGVLNDLFPFFHLVKGCSLNWAWCICQGKFQQATWPKK